MDILIQTYLTILPIVTTSVMGYVVWYLQNQKKANIKKTEEDNRKQEANCNGTKMILLYMLERLHTEYKMQGYVSHMQRDRFFEIYQAYHNLGGNGYGTALWKDVEEIEIRNDVESISPYAKLLKEAIQKGV